MNTIFNVSVFIIFNFCLLSMASSEAFQEVTIDDQNNIYLNIENSTFSSYSSRNMDSELELHSGQLHTTCNSNSFAISSASSLTEVSPSDFQAAEYNQTTVSPVVGAIFFQKANLGSGHCDGPFSGYAKFKVIAVEQGSSESISRVHLRYEYVQQSDIVTEPTPGFELPEPALTYYSSGLTMNVYWTAVADASGYTLHYAPYPYAGPETIASMNMGEETDFSIDLWDGATYYIAVQAYNQSGNSDFSNIELFTIEEFSQENQEAIDFDGDGYTVNQGDCDDSDASRHPGAKEVCGDGIDQDCDNDKYHCSIDLPACNGNQIFTHSPIDASLIDIVEPLGLVIGSGHDFPIDHIGLNVKSHLDHPEETEIVEVISPGNIHIVTIRATVIDKNYESPTNYKLMYFACSDITGVLDHLTTVTPEILGQLGSLEGFCQPPSEHDGHIYESCEKPVEISVAAGEKIGALDTTYNWGLDVGVYDQRIDFGYVNPESASGGEIWMDIQAACFMDYLVGPDVESLNSKLGRIDNNNGTIKVEYRTAEPVCGELMQDIANTAQGRWRASTTEEADHWSQIALVHDNIDPTLAAMSIGDGNPSIPANVYYFYPEPYGNKNADFSRVTSDGTTYCYEFSGHILYAETDSTNKRILIQMPSEDTLLISGVDGPHCESNETMPEGAMLYTR